MAYRPTKNTPVTAETTLRNAIQWLNIVRFGESGSVVQLQDDCEYRVTDIIENSSLLKKILGPYYRKYLLKYVPFKGNSLELCIRQSLIELLQDRKIPNPQYLELFSVNELLEYIAKTGFEVGLFIGRITPLLNEQDFPSLNSLELILEKCKNLSVILFFEKDITYPGFNILTDKCSLIFDNIIKYPLYAKEDSMQFIKYQTELWHLNVSKTLAEEIVRLSGGYLWMIATILRIHRDHPEFNMEQTLDDDLLIKKLEIIWNKFTGIEKKLIKNYFNKILTSGDKTAPEYLYLKKTGVFDFPLLKLIIKRENKISRLKNAGGRIYLNEIDITYELTKNERIFLDELLKNTGSVITRQKTAAAIWGNNWEEKYSDWALDRLAYRLRLKLKFIGIEPKLLKTEKKKGFRYG